MAEETKTRRAGRFLLPNQTDLLALSIALLVLTATLSCVATQSQGVLGFSGVDIWLMFLTLLTCSCGIAIGAIAGWTSFLRREVLICFLLCILSAGFVTYANYSYFQVNPVRNINGFLSSEETRSYLSSCIGPLAGFMVFFLLTRSLKLVPVFAKKVGGKFGIGRSGFLVGCAGILLVAGVAQNVFAPNGEWFSFLTQDGVLTTVFGVPLIVFFSWLVARRRWWWVQIGFLLLFCVPVGFAFLQFYLSGRTLWSIECFIFVGFCLVTVSFLSTMYGVRERLPNSSGFVSVWAFIVVVVLATMLAGYFWVEQNYQIGILFDARIPLGQRMAFLHF